MRNAPERVIVVPGSARHQTFVRSPSAAVHRKVAGMSMTDRDFDLVDGHFYIDGEERYRWGRANAPVYWDATNELWGIFRYDDIVEIEKRKDVFISSDQQKGGYRPNLPADDAIIGLDDPFHSQRRNLISRRFTPRAVGAWQDDIRAKVNGLLDAAQATGADVEVVEQLAAPLPAMMITKLLGFPEEKWPDLKYYSETTILLGGGPRYMNDEGIQAAVKFFTESAELFEEKKRCPMDDVMTVWTKAQIDGRPLTVEEVTSDCLLVLDGGAETTRTVIGRTILNLIANPDQWQLLKNGADIDVAVEEFIRYVSPVHNMCRVANRDYEIGGQTIKQGQQVVLLYPSANRDEKHFTNGDAFDVTRTPNNHIAFGFGTHFCLGASLARLEIKTFFEEFRRRVKSVRLVPGTTPVDMPSGFVHGLAEAHLDITWE